MELTNRVDERARAERKEGGVDDVRLRMGVGVGAGVVKWMPRLKEEEVRELFGLLCGMHSIGIVGEGFAPSRKEFCRGCGVKDTAYLKFFATYTAFVERCGYKMAAMRGRAERKARSEEVRGAVEEVMKKEEVKPVRPKQESFFGDRLEGYEMLHAPVNEQGVVMLFGMMAKRLGFLIELVRTGYPDCEAKRLGEDGRWRRVRIEFEYASSRFDHDPAGCDLIVCWEDDAKRSAVEVLELRTKMGR